MEKVKVYIVVNTRLNDKGKKNKIWVVKTQKGIDPKKAVNKEFAKKSDAIKFFKTLKMESIALVQDDKARYRYQIHTKVDADNNVSHKVVEFKSKDKQAKEVKKPAEAKKAAPKPVQKPAEVKKATPRPYSLYIVIKSEFNDKGEKTLKWVLKTPKSITSKSQVIYEVFETRQEAISKFKSMGLHLSAIVQNERARYDFKITPSKEETGEIVFKEFKYNLDNKEETKEIDFSESEFVNEEKEIKEKIIVAKEKVKVIEKEEKPSYNKFFSELEDVNKEFQGEPVYKEKKAEEIFSDRDKREVIDYSENLYESEKESVYGSTSSSRRSKINLIFPKSTVLTVFFGLAILGVFVAIVVILALFV